MTPGVVVGGSKLTVEAGARMLEAGGNAVDAAMAAVTMSFVAEPLLASLGGGGFALVHDAKRSQTFVLDFFVTAPALPEPEQQLDFYEAVCDYGSAIARVHIGRGSSAVPGCPAGVFGLQAELGRLAATDVVQPAVEACRKGVRLTETQALIHTFYEAILSATPPMRAIFRAQGRLKRASEVMRNPDLGDTLEALARAGPRLLYEGELARKIVEDQRSNGGLITMADLAAYQTVRRQPLAMADRGSQMLTNPPPSLGGLLIQFSRKLAIRVGLKAAGFGSAAGLELLAEVMRWTNLARAEHKGRPGVDLLSDESVEHWAQQLRASLAAPASERPVEPSYVTPSGTTQISVLDGEGNAVSLTTSPGYLGGYIVPETGLMMNNMLGEGDLNPGGFHAYVPGTRITSMMAPTLLLQNGRPVLATGSGGGVRLRDAILQTLTNLVDHEMALQQAVAAPRIHWDVGTLYVEPGLDTAAVDYLREKGYQLSLFDASNMFFGGAHTAAMADGRPLGAGDARREGSVASVDVD